MSTFNNATLMITDCTGSFCVEVLMRFFDVGLKEILIFSYGEKVKDVVCIDYWTNINSTY